MPKSTAPTIADVARTAGVSPAAVSKVLRRAPGVSRVMYETVERAIADLGYRPRVSARGMRGSTHTVGLVLPGAFSPFFSDLYSGVEAALQGTRLSVIIALAGEGDEDDSRAIYTLSDRQVDGLVLIAPHVSQAWIEELATRTNIVVVARHDESAAYDTVSGDDESGARQVMNHLLEAGHRDIVHIANRDGRRPVGGAPHGDHVRRIVYEKVMAEAGLSHRASVLESRFDEKVAYLSVRSMFSSGRIPSAIFAGADEAALGALRAVSELPPSVAEEIAVVGYDNTRFADHPSIGLSSVDQAAGALGARAAELLLERIAGRQAARRVFLEPELKVRRSSQRPAPVAREGGS